MHEKMAESSVTIRAVREDEVPQVLRFIRELAVYERLEHEVVATEERLRKALFGEPRYCEVVFACLDEEPVGFALFFHNFSTFLGLPGIYLEDLFVLPSARGRGIGQRLLAWLARETINRGCGRLDWSVLDWNEPAIRFYKALGATPMAEWGIFRLTGAALENVARQD
jgi:GNAT superfamily N-acetyltransferase